MTRNRPVDQPDPRTIEPRRNTSRETRNRDNLLQERGNLPQVGRSTTTRKGSGEATWKNISVGCRGGGERAEQGDLNCFDGDGREKSNPP